MSTMSRSEYDVISRRANEPVAASAALAGISKLSIKVRAEEYASARISWGSKITLDCVFSALSGTHADDFFYWGNPELAVTNLAGIRRFDDGIGNFIHAVISDEDFQFDLRHKVGGVFCASVDLVVSALLAIALYFRHGQAVNVDMLEGSPHIRQGEGFENCSYQFHVVLLLYIGAGWKDRRCTTSTHSSA